MMRMAAYGVLIAGLLAGCGGVEAADVPPAGDVWFGDTFDTETFELSGRTETVSKSETFALVGTLPRSIDGSRLMVRASWEGQQVWNQPADVSGSGEVWGFTYGPLSEAGSWTFELTDVGGNVLASGSVEAE